MIVYEIKQGDAARDIEASLYADGPAYNLATSTVRLVATAASTGASTSVVASIVSASGGRVRARIDSLLTTPETFALEWEVTDGARVWTWPSDSYDRLIVYADLD